MKENNGNRVIATALEPYWDWLSLLCLNIRTVNANHTLVNVVQLFHIATSNKQLSSLHKIQGVYSAGYQSQTLAPHPEQEYQHSLWFSNLPTSYILCSRGPQVLRFPVRAN